MTRCTRASRTASRHLLVLEAIHSPDRSAGVRSPTPHPLPPFLIGP
jgi:hypothetical protein